MQTPTPRQLQIRHPQTLTLRRHQARPAVVLTPAPIRQTGSATDPNAKPANDSTSDPKKESTSKKKKGLKKLSPGRFRIAIDREGSI